MELRRNAGTGRPSPQCPYPRRGSGHGRHLLMASISQDGEGNKALVPVPWSRSVPAALIPRYYTGRVAVDPYTLPPGEVMPLLRH